MRKTNRKTYQRSISTDSKPLDICYSPQQYYAVESLCLYSPCGALYDTLKANKDNITAIPILLFELLLYICIPSSNIYRTTGNKWVNIMKAVVGKDSDVDIHWLKTDLSLSL